MRPKIAVLLSTYNGERFLREQLDSILNQEDVEVELLVRDDGSSDLTIQILTEYLTKHDNIKVLQSKNVGCERSYAILMRESPKDSEYFAFADQDDVWFADKLKHSVDVLSGFSNTPTLYCCNQIITDESLTPLKKMIEDESFSFVSHEMEVNYLKNRHGCTMVWNKKLHDILCNIKLSQGYTPVHDKMLNMVARCAGQVIIDKKPLQYYRIHGNNVSGLAESKWSRLRKGIRLYWVRKNNSNLYARDCIRSIPNIDYNREGAILLRKVAEYKDSLAKRINLMNAKQLRYEGNAYKIFWNISILLGKL